MWPSCAPSACSRVAHGMGHGRAGPARQSKLRFIADSLGGVLAVDRADSLCERTANRATATKVGARLKSHYRTTARSTTSTTKRATSPRSRAIWAAPTTAMTQLEPPHQCPARRYPANPGPAPGALQLRCSTQPDIERASAGSVDLKPGQPAAAIPAPQALCARRAAY